MNRPLGHFSLLAAMSVCVFVYPKSCNCLKVTAIFMLKFFKKEKFLKQLIHQYFLTNIIFRLVKLLGKDESSILELIGGPKISKKVKFP